MVGKVRTVYGTDSLWYEHCMVRIVVRQVQTPGHPRTLAVGQLSDRIGWYISVPTWTRLQTGESIPVLTWTSPRGGQVHYSCCRGGIVKPRSVGIKLSILKDT